MLKSAAMAPTRRSFLLTGAGLAAAQAMVSAARQAQSAPGALTASAVIDRIKGSVGVPWQAETVDRIVAGAPDTRVRGIATTMMATLEVVERAAAAGKNMVITHEPDLLLAPGHHRDAAAGSHLSAQGRLHTHARHGRVPVFTYHWHARRPDGIATGMARELGWEKQADPASPRRFVFADVPLAQFTRDIQTRLAIRTMRVVGDPKLAVKRVAVSWGYTSLVPGLPTLARPDVDVLVVGESREWEVVEVPRRTA